MSAPFQPGDCVVCIDNTTAPKNTGFPPIQKLLTIGQAYRIDLILQSKTPAGYHMSIVGIAALFFEPWRFRKIDDEVTVSFREQLRAIKTPEHNPRPAISPRVAGSARGITASHSDAPRAAHSGGSR